MKKIVHQLWIFVASCLLTMAMAGSGFAGDNGKLKFSVLCDDTAVSDTFITEHGVSIFIELPNGHHWLLDTGTTDIYMQNAKLMNISLDNLTGIAISHGHDDHTGGLTFYPRLKGKPPVYGHPYIWHKQYGVKTGQPVRICGMPYLARKYTDPVFVPRNGVSQLDENMYFFTDIPREPGSYTPTHGKFQNEDGTGPCPIIDDATIAIRTPRGIVAVFGCGHAGYINILKEIRKKFPNEKLLSVIGGLHLKSADDAVLAKAVAYTDTIKAKKFTFYGGHCTGANAIKYFKNAYGDKVVKPLGAGSVIEF